MTSYLITFPNLFERAKFEETKEQYFICLKHISKEYIKTHSDTFIEICLPYFDHCSFFLSFPNCRIVRKCIKGKKVHYECINKG